MKLTKLVVVALLGLMLVSLVACSEGTEPTIPTLTPTATCTQPTIPTPTPTATSTASAMPTSTASASATCTIMMNEWVYFLRETGYHWGGSADPAACYCHELGYDMRVEEGPLGQSGICIFPDGTECEEWAFFKGQCGQEWSFCEQQGGEIIILNSSTKYRCYFFSPCPYCILSCEE